MEHSITHGSLEAFILGGHGTLTIESPSGKRFTFKMSKTWREESPVYVSVLTGPNNESDYTYLGPLFQGTKTFYHGKKSTVSKDAPSVKAFEWFWKCVVANKVPEALKVFHHGHCGRCGRKLTVPESIETGLGPVCASR